MAFRNIVEDGDPILKKVCRPVIKFDARLGQLLDDMAETLLDADGLGLAGPQVGVMRRMFVAVEVDSEENNDDEGENLDDAPETEPDESSEETRRVLEFINPEIVEQEGEILAYEGCLSFPGLFGAIRRPAWVKVRAFDREGKPFVYEAKGLMARCLCHETNHLDGVTIDDLAKYFYDPEDPLDIEEVEELEKAEAAGVFDDLKIDFEAD